MSYKFKDLQRFLLLVYHYSVPGIIYKCIWSNHHILAISKTDTQCLFRSLCGSLHFPQISPAYNYTRNNIFLQLDVCHTTLETTWRRQLFYFSLDAKGSDACFDRPRSHIRSLSSSWGVEQLSSYSVPLLPPLIHYKSCISSTYVSLYSSLFLCKGPNFWLSSYHTHRGPGAEILSWMAYWPWTLPCPMLPPPFCVAIVL